MVATTTGTIGGAPVTLSYQGTPGVTKPIDNGFMTNYFSDNPLTNALNITMHPLDFLGDATAAGSTAASGAITGSASVISDLFLRGTIIILGFIFVAAALSMFKPSTSISLAKTASKVVL